VIRFADPGASYRAHQAEIDAAVARVMASGWYVLGPEVEAFERDFAAWSGAAHAIGVGNGTDALQLALMALDIGAGDAVLTVAHTAVATVSAIRAAGAEPVFVDIEPGRMLLDLDALDAAYTPATRAVIAVHLYGHPIDMPALCAWAEARGVYVVEDCAQAHGARWKGTRVGRFGALAGYSFYPTKNLGALGDGGMVTTDDPALATRVRRLRTYGWDDTRSSVEPGINSRLDPIQAAILRAKLPHLDDDIGRRDAIARRYSKALADLPIELPSVAPEAAHAWHLYVMVTAHRDALMTHLRAAGVAPGIHYAPPVHRQPAFASGIPLPQTERAARRVLSLPMYPELTEAAQDRVIDAIRSFFAAPEATS